MTFILKLDKDVVKIYHCANNEVSTSQNSEVIACTNIDKRSMFQVVDTALQHLTPHENCDDENLGNGGVQNRENERYLVRNVMPLLKSLNEQDKLPCLVFR